MSRVTTAEQPWAFQGFAHPGMTQIPDEFFDVLAPRLKEAELRVMLYIMRRTFGFKKSSDDISLKQMVEGIRTKEGRVLDLGTGLSKPAVIRAVKSLVHQQIIIATSRRSAAKGDEPTTYTLHFKHEPLPDPVLTKVTRGGNSKLHGGVNEVNPQETVLQETVLQETDTRISISTASLHNEKKERSRPRKRVSNDQSDIVGDSMIREQPGKRNRGASESTRPTLQQATAHGFTTLGEVLTHHKPGGVSSAPESPAALVTLPNNTDRLPPRHTPVLAHPDASQTPSTSPARRGKRLAAPPEIKTFMRDLSSEFHDSDHEAANLSQALHLLQQVGYPVTAFLSMLYQARSITKQQGNIQKPANGEQGRQGLRNRMPYFFSVLRDELGIARDQ